MIAFVTGGTGFIGSHLVDFLHTQGVTEVRCLVRKDEKWLRGRTYTPVKGDLHDLEALKKGLQGADTLFHLAGAVKAAHLPAFIRENVEGTENVIRVALKSGIKRIVVLSSLAAAGPSEGKPLHEGDICRPVSSYGQSKLKMEEALAAIPFEGIQAAIIRPPAVYGPREENILPVFKLMNKGICPVVGDSSNRVSMIYVKDLVEGLWNAANRTPEGLNTYFMADLMPYSWADVASVAGSVVGRKVRTIPIPPEIVVGAGSIFDRAGKLFGKKPFFDKEKAAEITAEWMCSSEKAARMLQFQPKYSLARGFQETIQWYSVHHWL
jgi:nucleoside-diphosphate-sugar epimerase